MADQAIGARHKSALKRSRQNIKRRIRNVRICSAVKTVIKGVKSSVEKKDHDEAVKALKKAIPAIDKAVSKGVMHRKTASRKISRLSRLVNTLSA